MDWIDLSIDRWVLELAFLEMGIVGYCGLNVSIICKLPHYFDTTTSKCNVPYGSK